MNEIQFEKAIGIPIFPSIDEITSEAEDEEKDETTHRPRSGNDPEDSETVQL